MHSSTLSNTLYTSWLECFFTLDSWCFTFWLRLALMFSMRTVYPCKSPFALITVMHVTILVSICPTYFHITTRTVSVAVGIVSRNQLLVHVASTLVKRCIPFPYRSIITGCHQALTIWTKGHHSNRGITACMFQEWNSHSSFSSFPTLIHIPNLDLSLLIANGQQVSIRTCIKSHKPDLTVLHAKFPKRNHIIGGCHVRLPTPNHGETLRFGFQRTIQSLTDLDKIKSPTNCTQST